MKFHLIAVSLLGACIGILYLILSGVQSDFDRASEQIQKEAFENFKAHRKRAQDSAQTQISPLQRDTPRAVSEVSVFNQVGMMKRTESPQVASVDPRDDAPVGIMIEKVGDSEYWCRESAVQKLKTPVKCFYPSSCYGCQGSSVIPPESDTAIPFCENGNQAELFSIECCPNSFTAGDIECPSARECLHADSVPKDYCSCNNRPDCRLITIGEQIQCVCIQ